MGHKETGQKADCWQTVSSGKAPRRAPAFLGIHWLWSVVGSSAQPLPKALVQEA